jgi:hypothetical protein
VVVELSWYGDARVTLPLGGPFHALRLRLRSSQVGGLPPGQRPRWTHARRRALALRLLADPRLDRLVEARTPFADLPAVMQRLDAGELGGLCQVIDYGGEHRP